MIADLINKQKASARLEELQSKKFSYTMTDEERAELETLDFGRPSKAPDKTEYLNNDKPCGTCGAVDRYKAPKGRKLGTCKICHRKSVEQYQSKIVVAPTSGQYYRAYTSGYQSGKSDLNPFIIFSNPGLHHAWKDGRKNKAAGS